MYTYIVEHNTVIHTMLFVVCWLFLEVADDCHSLEREIKGDCHTRRYFIPELVGSRGNVKVVSLKPLYVHAGIRMS